MVIALVGLALAMMAGGMYLALDGYSMIVLERGWSLLIAGSTIASLGAVLLGIAMATWRLGQVRTEIVRLRDKGPRTEPGFSEPPRRVDAAGPGNVASPPPRAEPTFPDAAVAAGSAAGAGEPSLPAAPSLEAFFAGPPVAERERTRAARREEKRRASRRGQEGGGATSAGAVAAGAAAALAAGAAVSAGLAAMRGRRNGASGENGADTSAEPVPPGDELLPDRNVEADTSASMGGAGTSQSTVAAADVPSSKEGGNLPAMPHVEESPSDVTAIDVEDGPPTVMGTYNSGGNRYIMFSNGSIDAETPDGVFRFGSLDELKAFIAAGGERPA